MGIGAPALAVDGDTNQHLTAGHSCSHTSENDNSPFWSVRLSQNCDVNRFAIYNRGDCCPERLKGFILTVYDQNHVKMFTHTDKQTTAQNVYSVTSVTIPSPIKSVEIEATYVGVTDVVPILTLCEVEVYGDTTCTEVKYGRECEYECHCANNESCFVSTGRCPNECALGYTGIHCDQPCSYNCATGQCDSTTGRCDQCPSGRTGDLCDQACSPAKWGPRCINTCSVNCKNQYCDGVTGRCNECPSGKTGDLCNQACSVTKWGPRCIQTCSSTCMNKQCNAETGVCNECPSGKTGDQCNQVCSPITYGSRCINACSTNCVDRRCNGASGVCDKCPDMKFGDQCDRDCPIGKYGFECNETCSDNCKVPGHCDSLSGTCFNGCGDGYKGDICNIHYCPAGKYGATCDKTCNQNCRDLDCESNTGECSIGCVPGYSGTMCQQECEPGKYGTDCSSDCSEFCNTNETRENESPCHPVSGTCSYGCVQGYQGPACNTKPQSSSSSDSESGVGVGVGIGVGVCVLVAVAVAVVGIYFYRRRTLAQKSRRERPPGYDPAEPTTEEHNYSELFKSEDGYNLPTDEASSPVTLNVTSKTVTPDVVQYVNSEGKADVNTYVTPYEDIDHITSDIDQGKSSKAGQNNSGYANF